MSGQPWIITTDSVPLPSTTILVSFTCTARLPGQPVVVTAVRPSGTLACMVAAWRA